MGNMSDAIILPGDDKKATMDSNPTVVLQEQVQVLEDTTLADGHATKKEIRKQLLKDGEDWGDGFIVANERVLIQRAPDGSIIRTTPLSEIPGVHVGEETLEYDEAIEAAEKPTPVTLSRSDRHKLVAVLTKRLFNYYKDRGPGDPRYNPFNDGIVDAPSGSNEHLAPLPGSKMYPATDGQIQEWLTQFIASRVSVIDRRRFGKDNLQDLALHIE